MGRLSKFPGMVTAAGLLAACATAGAGDWPQFRGPNRDGISAETGWVADWPASGPKVVWKADVGVGYSAVSVVGDRLYTMGNADGRDRVWCLEAATGKEVWSHRYACLDDEAKRERYPGPRMTPTVDGGAVFTLSRYGHVFCLGAADGKVRWSVNVMDDHGVRQTKFRWGLAGSPLVAGKRVVFDLGGSCAFEKATGKLAWRALDGAAAFSSPVRVEVDGKAHVTAFNADGFALLNLADGGLLGQLLPFTNRYLANIATPIVTGGKVFIASGYGRGCALLEPSAAGLKAIYQKREMECMSVSPVLHEGHVYTGTGHNKGFPISVELSTGKVAWGPVRNEGQNSAAIAYADGRLYFRYQNGLMVLVEATPEAYREHGSFMIPDVERQSWPHPVIADGKLYLREQDNLFCYDISVQN